MNRYLLKQNIIGLLFFTCLFVGCDNAEYSVLHNQAYISQTGTNPNTALKVFIDQDLVTANLNVRLSDPAETIILSLWKMLNYWQSIMKLIIHPINFFLPNSIILRGKRL